MRRLVRRGVIVVLIALAAQVIHAEGVGLTAKISTLGPGVDLTMGLSEKASVRVGINAMNLDLDFSDDDTENNGDSAKDINVEIDFMTFGALLDWHPWAGGFRVTGGLILNNNEVNMTADLNDTVDVNDVEYSVTSLDGNISFNTLAPYLGIGWGNAVEDDGRWSFAFDFGVMFQGAPEATLTATASDPALQDQLNADIQREIDTQEEDADMLSFWPVISFGVSYRF